MANLFIALSVSASPHFTVYFLGSIVSMPEPT